MSKGSKPRPIKDPVQFRDNWDEAFRKKHKKVKPRQRAKKEKLDYNPFSFLKY